VTLTGKKKSRRYWSFLKKESHCICSKNVEI
jgi:hypothetical protein